MSKKAPKLNKWFYKPILDEKKITIIRTDHMQLCKGDKVMFEFLGINKKIESTIDNVERTMYSRLTNSDAKDAGYLHVDLLKKELNDLYHNIEEDEVLYIISFTIDGSVADNLVKEILENMKKITVVQ